jgi:hypothetical protein
VNEKDTTTRQQIININHDELVHLPNKSFYNGDGSKIQILGAVSNTKSIVGASPSKPPFIKHHHQYNHTIAENYAFTPLI